MLIVLVPYILSYDGFPVHLGFQQGKVILTQSTDDIEPGMCHKFSKVESVGCIISLDFIVLPRKKADIFG